MGIKIRYKLFFILLTASVLIIAGMFVFTRISFERGLIRYMDKMQMRHLEAMCSILEYKYEKEKSWDFFRNNPSEWEQFTHDTFRHYPPPPCKNSEIGRYHENARWCPPPPPENHHMEPIEKTQGFMAWMHKRGPRAFKPCQIEMVLMDKDRKPIIGHIEGAKQTRLMPIMYEKDIVGWLGMVLPDNLVHEEELLFFHRQSRMFLMISLAMILVSIIVSVWASYYLEGPIRVLKKGTRDLASGLYKTRIPVTSKDELGQLSSDFNDLASTLEENEKDRKKWVEDIAHELRTPLTLLNGELEAVEDGVRELNDETIQRLKGDISHLIRLINDLNELSGTDKGALTYRKETVNLIDVIRQVSERFRDSFREGKLDFQDHFGDDQIIPVMADPERLAQLFNNILKNALDYSDTGGKVMIRLEKQAAEVTVHIEDSGPGVPVESLPRLFERLYRVDRSRNRKSGGSGLGLAICRNIVEAHGGTISASPSGLGGLSINIELPLYRE